MSAGEAFHLVAWLLLRRADGRVLLARRAADMSYGPGLWNLPGGHVEDHETLAQAACREAREEVGVTVDPARCTPLGVSRYVDRGVRGADFFFAADAYAGTPEPLSECSEVGWFAPGALPADSLPWLQGVLDGLAANWLAELLDADE